MLVCIGATTFVLVSLGLSHSTPDAASTNVSRVLAAVVTGIGFLGAGTILHGRGQVEGLTTAAGLWVVAGIGTAVGLGAYAVGLTATILALVTLRGLVPLIDRWSPGSKPESSSSDTDN